MGRGVLLTADLCRSLLVSFVQSWKSTPLLMLRTQYYLISPWSILLLKQIVLLQILKIGTQFTPLKHMSREFQCILKVVQPLLSPLENIFILPPPRFPHPEAVTAHFLLPKSLLVQSDCSLLVTLFWTLRLDEVQPQVWFLCLSHCVLFHSCCSVGKYRTVSMSEYLISRS